MPKKEKKKQQPDPEPFPMPVVREPVPMSAPEPLTAADVAQPKDDDDITIKIGDPPPRVR